MKLEISDVTNSDSSASEHSRNSSDIVLRDGATTAATSLYHHFGPLVSFDGLHSGVPTRTTSTLTPTTLRNIEQTFIELSNESPVSLPCQAGFVPPPPLAPSSFPFEQDHSLGSTGSNSSESWQTTTAPLPPNTTNGNRLNNNSSSNNHNNVNNNHDDAEEDDCDDDDDDDDDEDGGDDHDDADDRDDDLNNTNSTITPHSTPPPSSASSVTSTVTPQRRNMGGRRPNKPANLSPEEEQKRSVRRERNKLAAARCRKRRVDHTNELSIEVDGLQKKRQNLQSEIQALQQEKEDLEFLLDSHRAHCRLQARTTNAASPIDIKPKIAMLTTILGGKVKQEEHSDSSLDGPPSPKRAMLSNTNVMANGSDHRLSTATSTATTTIGAGVTAAVAGPPPAQCSQISSVSDSIDSNNQMSIVLMAPQSNAMQLPSMTRRPNRPSTLNVPLTMTPSQALNAEYAGVPITTPSNGMFNFDSLMDGGTGLTPVAAPLIPTCSSTTTTGTAGNVIVVQHHHQHQQQQQHHSHHTVSHQHHHPLSNTTLNSNKHPLELTTPTSSGEPSKLVSL